MRALTLMVLFALPVRVLPTNTYSQAYYTEGVGSPHLEYTLISEAMRLATSKGLHRQPSVSQRLSVQAINSRCWLFWAIYSLDRQIASRSGRPPVWRPRIQLTFLDLHYASVSVKSRLVALSP